MSIAGRQSDLALRIGMIVLALLVASEGLAGAARAQAVGAALSGLITDEPRWSCAGCHGEHQESGHGRCTRGQLERRRLLFPRQTCCRERMKSAWGPRIPDLSSEGRPPYGWGAAGAECEPPSRPGSTNRRSKAPLLPTFKRIFHDQCN